MPNPDNQFKVDFLKTEIEKNFGRRILSSRDCIYLTEEIFEKSGHKLNSNTLRRFFGLVAAKYPSSQATLDLLSQYCGYNSFSEIEFKPVNEESEATDKQLLKYLVSIFKNTPVVNVNDDTYMNLVRHTVIYLKNVPALIPAFQREIAKTKNGQEFYYEQFIDIDKLDQYFGDGLHHYIREKKTIESFIWANALLCFRYWLTTDHEKLEKSYRSVQQNFPDQQMHPFVSGRFFAAAIYHAKEYILPIHKILEEARIFFRSIKPGTDNYRSFPCFEYVFSEALVLTGHFEEALFYIGLANARPPVREKYIDEGFFVTIEICKGIALAGLGETAEAFKIYSAIKPQSFYFLSKSYNMILLLTLCIKLNRCSSVQVIQMNQLITETGFIRFREVLSSLKLHKNKGNHKT